MLCVTPEVAVDLRSPLKTARLIALCWPALRYSPDADEFYRSDVREFYAARSLGFSEGLPENVVRGKVWDTFGRLGLSPMRKDVDEVVDALKAVVSDWSKRGLAA